MKKLTIEQYFNKCVKDDSFLESQLATIFGICPPYWRYTKLKGRLPPGLPFDYVGNFTASERIGHNDIVIQIANYSHAVKTGGLMFKGLKFTDLFKYYDEVA